MPAAYKFNLPTELQEEILSYLYTPVELWDMSNPDRKRETALNRAALKAYSQTCRECAMVARKHLFATIVLDIPPSRRGAISQLEQDLDNFAHLLEASTAFKFLGMVYHIRSFTMRISTPAAANLFLTNTSIRRILPLLLPDCNSGIYGVEFFAILSRTTIDYHKVSSETIEILQRIMDSERNAHVMLRRLKGLPDQLFDELRNRGKNVEMYQCSTISRVPVESMGWGDPDQAYFEAKSLDIPESIKGVQHLPTTLRTLRIHLPAIPIRRVRFALIPNAPPAPSTPSAPPTPPTQPTSESPPPSPTLPEIPLDLLHNLTFLHITQTSAPRHSKDVFRQFLPYLPQCRFPPSLTTLKIETRTKMVLGSDQHHLNEDQLSKLDEVLNMRQFHNIANVTIAVKCHLSSGNHTWQPVSEARREQIRLSIEEAMIAGLPLFLQVDQSRRRCFDISVEDATTMEYAKVRTGGRKQLVVPFFEPAPEF